MFYLLVSGFLIAMVLIDQLIKFAVVKNLQPILIYELIPGIFRLRYVENSGAIFGSFSGTVVILNIFSTAIVAITLYHLITKRVTPKYVFACLLLMASGSVGHLVDRIRLGYVIDYLEPTFINFAVFKFADCLITVGACLLIVYLIKDFAADMKNNKNKVKSSNE